MANNPFPHLTLKNHKVLGMPNREIFTLRDFVLLSVKKKSWGPIPPLYIIPYCIWISLKKQEKKANSLFLWHVDSLCAIFNVRFGIHIGGTRLNFLRGIWQKIVLSHKGENFLCDLCKYDWGDACRRRERPNATKCPDYKRRWERDRGTRRQGDREKERCSDAFALCFISVVSLQPSLFVGIPHITANQREKCRLTALHYVQSQHNWTGLLFLAKYSAWSSPRLLSSPSE